MRQFVPFKTKGGATMGRLLGKETITERLLGLKEWVVQGKELRKLFEFDDFKEAMRFVNAVAAAAEKVDHHPDITINYNKVSLALSTHSDGGLTGKDFDLAHDIDFI
jgi:4a-hydroxytetrahydrobiopterin dehydratase